MMELSQARQGWEEIDALETQLLRRLTVQQGILQYLALQREFEPQLQETEGIFRQQRIQALTQLQARLTEFSFRNGAVMDYLIRSVADLQRRLEKAGIPSAVIGGLAVGAWGEPRLTRDVDLKVLAQRDERGRAWRWPSWPRAIWTRHWRTRSVGWRSPARSTTIPGRQPPTLRWGWRTISCSTWRRLRTICCGPCRWPRPAACGSEPMPSLLCWC